MIVIVGHGPSSGHAPPFEQHTVVRLLTAGYDKPGRHAPHPGERTDFTCSTQEKYEPDWLIKGELDHLCRSTLAPYKPKNPKPSTGLCACIIARHLYPDEEIRVVGFDWTLNPDLAINYIHDAYAEHECLKSLDITEYGRVL